MSEEQIALNKFLEGNLKFYQDAYKGIDKEVLKNIMSTSFSFGFLRGIKSECERVIQKERNS
jgi:hypothetical protein